MKLALLARRSISRRNSRLGLALVLLLAAVGVPDVELPGETFNYMVTFDISQSMDVEDVTLGGWSPRPWEYPRPPPGGVAGRSGAAERWPAEGAIASQSLSRLALARSAMREVLLQLPCGSRVGWSIFADYRSFPLVLPIEVCRNHEALLSTLEKIDARMRWANASNVGKGLYWALRNAQTMPGTRIVFVTDGHEAPPQRPGAQPMPGITPGQIGGWVIGVGGDVPSRIPKTNAEGGVVGYWTAEDVVQAEGLPPGQGHEHLSQLQERYLESLAAHTGLGYRRLVSPASLREAMFDKRWADPAPVPKSLRWIPALLALLLLAWEFAPDRPLRNGRLTPSGD